MPTIIHCLDIVMQNQNTTKCKGMDVLQTYETMKPRGCGNQSTHL